MQKLSGKETSSPNANGKARLARRCSAKRKNHIEEYTNECSSAVYLEEARRGQDMNIEGREREISFSYFVLFDWARKGSLKLPLHPSIHPWLLYWTARVDSLASDDGNRIGDTPNQHAIANASPMAMDAGQAGPAHRRHQQTKHNATHSSPHSPNWRVCWLWLGSSPD